MPIPLGILAVAGAGGAAANSFEFITSGQGGSSFTFSSIPQDYKHLQIRYRAQGDVNSTTDYLNMRFNSDSSSSYGYQYIYGQGSSVAAGWNSGQSAIGFNDGPLPSTGQSVSGSFGVGIIDILDYTSSKRKLAKIMAGRQNTGGNWLTLSNGFWNNTSAITSITFTPQNSSFFNSGTLFALYGIKG